MNTAYSILRLIVRVRLSPDKRRSITGSFLAQKSQKVLGDTAPLGRGRARVALVRGANAESGCALPCQHCPQGDARSEPWRTTKRCARQSRDSGQSVVELAIIRRQGSFDPRTWPAGPSPTPGNRSYRCGWLDHSEDRWRPKLLLPCEFSHDSLQNGGSLAEALHRPGLTPRSRGEVSRRYLKLRPG
jgi:hypothetical protein